MSHLRTALLALILLVFVSASAPAQGPSADWQTLTTPHFRVHYPAPSEAWARRAAARLEAIRERVAEEVGYAPSEVVDVLISDPVADPNGVAYPFLGWPRMRSLSHGKGILESPQPRRYMKELVHHLRASASELPRPACYHVAMAQPEGGFLYAFSRDSRSR